MALQSVLSVSVESGKIFSTPCSLSNFRSQMRNNGPDRLGSRMRAFLPYHCRQNNKYDYYEKGESERERERKRERRKRREQKKKKEECIDQLSLVSMLTLTESRILVSSLRACSRSATRLITELARWAGAACRAAPAADGAAEAEAAGRGPGDGAGADAEAGAEEAPPAFPEVEAETLDINNTI